MGVVRGLTAILVSALANFVVESVWPMVEVLKACFLVGVKESHLPRPRGNSMLKATGNNTVRKEELEQKKVEWRENTRGYPLSRGGRFEIRGS